MKYGMTALLLLGLAAQASAGEEAGTVKTVKGRVTIERGMQALAAQPGQRIEVADRVVTGADGAVGITLRDSTLLSAGPNSSLSLDAFAFNATTHAGRLDAGVKRGTLAVISGKLAKNDPESVRFRTPTVTLGVRGTEFAIDVAEGE